MAKRLSLLPLVLTLAGCGGGGDAPPANQVVVALRNAPTHLDPRIGTDQSSARAFDLMLNGLVTKAANGDLVPELATSWEVLDDGLRYRFHLREGVRFHDGRELTAEDVVWTFGSIVDGTVISPKAGAFSHVERVEAAGPLTVDFVLRRPFGAMLADLTSFVGIVPAGVDPEQFERSPVGSGPFRLVERTPDAIGFAAWDAYWEGRPQLDRVVLRAVPDATGQHPARRRQPGPLPQPGVRPARRPGRALSRAGQAAALYLEAQEILARDLPYISLFNRLDYAVLPRTLEGYRNYTSGELYSLKQARWAAGG